MPHDVFISYSTEDAGAANKICPYLEDRGIRCWIAPRDIESGVSYPVAIIQAIRNAKAIVIVVSANSVGSDHVSSEMNAAFNNRIPIIGFRTDKVTPSEEMEYYLGSRNWINAYT